MNPSATNTAPITLDGETVESNPAPGLVAVFSGRPIAIPFGDGAHIGREVLAKFGIEDEQMSREHLVVESRAALAVLDCGSRNGTFVDGERIIGRKPIELGTTVRAGRTLFVAVPDTSRFTGRATSVQDDVVSGPTTHDLLERARAMGQLEQLLVTGESGVGKELVARAFHSKLDPRAPFVALNCATIQAGIAERLLFGARKGVYTGAEQDADGYIHAANGGTLFLDEIAELDLSVQAKLLRFLETREYFPLGETKPRSAKVRMCFATLRDLAGEVSARRFREDLYHRIATPSVTVPPLSARREEIPFLIELQARRFSSRVRLSTAFVERALRAPWPGNVRQLLRTVDAAFVGAEVEGRANVSASDIPAMPVSEEIEEENESTSAVEPTDEDIREAMATAEGNISVAARALGVHRSKLRRRLLKLG